MEGSELEAATAQGTLGLAPRLASPLPLLGRRGHVLVLTALIQFVLACATRQFVGKDAHVVMIWLPSGFGMAAAWMFGARAVPGVFAGALASALLLGTLPFHAMLESLAYGVEAAVGGLLLRRLVSPPPELERLRDFLRFGALGVVVAPLAGALLGMLSLYGAFDGARLLASGRMWWLADGLGVLVFTPVALAWAAPAPHARPARAPELALLGAGSLAVASLVFLGLPRGVQVEPVMVLLTLPFLAWAGLRAGPRVAASAQLGVAVLAALGAQRGLGVFAALGPEARAWQLLVIQAVSAFTTHAIAAGSMERWRTEGRLRESRRALASTNHVLETVLRAQANFIQDGDPQPVELLRGLLDLTGSRYGFLCAFPEDGLGASPVLEFAADSGASAQRPIDLDPLIQAVRRSEGPLVLRHPARDPRLTAAPTGVPPLQAFLGVPLRSEGVLLGMVGLANRPQGYPAGVVRDLEPILATWTSLLEAHRNLEARRRAEVRRLRAERERRRAAKLEAVGRLAAGVSHQFNNLLLILGSNVEALKRGGMASADEAATYRTLEKALDRARALVRQILTFGRPEETARTRLSLETVVTSAVEFLDQTFRKRVSFELAAEPGLPAVQGSFSQLEQVVVNLCTNAAQALEPEGGRVRIELARVEVTGREAPEPGRAGAAHPPPGRYVALRVKDDGPGMDEATLERVFDPFFTTKGIGQGTGLGLSVVHGIVLGHGGTVRATSRPGQGTVLEVLLPAQDELAREVVIPYPSARGRLAPGRGEHLLFVDDEPGVVSAFSSLLRNLGYRVTGHTDPNQALADFLAHPDDFDGCFTDYAMQGLDGVQLAARLHAVRPDLPIALTSGYGDPLGREEMLRAGLREVLSKPYPIEELAQVLRRLFEPVEA